MPSFNPTSPAPQRRIIVKPQSPGKHHIPPPNLSPLLSPGTGRRRKDIGDYWLGKTLGKGSSGTVFGNIFIQPLLFIPAPQHATTSLFLVAHACNQLQVVSNLAYTRSRVKRLPSRSSPNHTLPQMLLSNVLSNERSPL